jgi:hypothetical protein
VDRIRAANDTGLHNLTLHEPDQNRISCTIVTLACELTAWAQMVTFTEGAAGNPNGYGCGRSPSPGMWLAQDDCLLYLAAQAPSASRRGSSGSGHCEHAPHLADTPNPPFPDNSL